MARVKLSPFSSYSFECEIPLRITDMNYGNHLGNDTLLSVLHEARVRYFKSLGQSEMNFFGSGLIMADIALQYKSEAFSHETLKISIRPFDPGITGFDLFYEVNTTEDNRLVALGKTHMVCFNYAEKRMETLPEQFLKHIPA
jgi:acyl-CoA thioester hydrolase